jgi:signal transduction histidine kinase
VSAADVAAVAEDCWRNVDTTGATLVVDATLTVRADEMQFRQLFENLIRNAVEHGSAADRTDDGADVTVTVGDLPDGFYVEDDGVGIPPEEYDAVFEPGHSTSPSGTGFGLSIVKQVAESHGWTVGLAEGSAGGARFEFTGVERVEAGDA